MLGGLGYQKSSLSYLEALAAEEPNFYSASAAEALIPPVSPRPLPFFPLFFNLKSLPAPFIRSKHTSPESPPHEPFDVPDSRAEDPNSGQRSSTPAADHNLLRNFFRTPVPRPRFQRLLVLGRSPQALVFLNISPGNPKGQPGLRTTELPRHHPPQG